VACGFEAGASKMEHKLCSSTRNHGLVTQSLVAAPYIFTRLDNHGRFHIKLKKLQVLKHEYAEEKTKGCHLDDG
jgi:hypothetical protein